MSYSDVGDVTLTTILNVGDRNQYEHIIVFYLRNFKSHKIWLHKNHGIIRPSNQSSLPCPLFWSPIFSTFTSKVFNEAQSWLTSPGASPFENELWTLKTFLGQADWNTQYKLPMPYHNHQLGHKPQLCYLHEYWGRYGFHKVKFWPHWCWQL